MAGRRPWVVMLAVVALAIYGSFSADGADWPAHPIEITEMHLVLDLKLVKPDEQIEAMAWCDYTVDAPDGFEEEHEADATGDYYVEESYTWDWDSDDGDDSHATASAIDGNDWHQQVQYDVADAYTLEVTCTATVYEIVEGGPDAEIASDTASETAVVNVCQMWLYRDSGYIKELDCWRDNDQHPDSPKYVFGEDDAIYMRVKGLGSDDHSQQESISDAVRVTSESDSSGVPLTLKETGTATNVFNNSLSGGDELLYLGTESGQGTGDKIEVVDEEVLDFGLKGDSEYKPWHDVMVDRGEWMAVAASEGPAGDMVDNFNQNVEFAKDGMTDDYDWWNDGYLIGELYDSCDEVDEDYEERKHNALTQARDVQEADSSADILFFCGHGSAGCLNIFGDCEAGKHEIWQPHQNDVTGWPDDVEFVVFDACNVLGNEEDPDAYVASWICPWAQHLFDTGIHAVLATCKTVAVEALDDDFKPFIDEIESGTRVVDAWKNACTGFFTWDTPYGILVRESNLNDYVTTPVANAVHHLTKDSEEVCDATDFIYYWYDGNQEDPCETCGSTTQGSGQETARDIVRDSVVFDGTELVPN